jgi:outer membrane protein OmpA-like peptidoglycan-associated protein
MKTLILRVASILFVGVLAGCATTPQGPSPEVMRLNNQLAQLQADQRIAPNAADEISKAQDAVNALATQARSLDEKNYQQRVYVADRLVQTAEAIGLARFQEKRGEQLGRERDQLLLRVKSNQAAQAQQAASVAQASAEAERRNAEIAREETARSRSQLDDLRSKLTELQTKQTERGLIVTLGDVLFEVDKADLKPGTMRSLNQLAAALRNDPDTSLRIEGYTDSTGSRAHNMDLSSQRAESVKSYLVSNGVDATHIAAQGMGPDSPVASNNTAAGRQQNRRVEVIINDDNKGG